MKRHVSILEQDLGEQMALEEQLCQTIEQQLSDVDEDRFPEAAKLLKAAREVLVQHFSPLNELLDNFELEALEAKKEHSAAPILAFEASSGKGQEDVRVSKILRDDYSALNQIAVGNTMLHVTALALDYENVAAVALEHLHNLAPLVMKIHELVPHIVAQELVSKSVDVDKSILSTALGNIRKAWQER